MASLREITTTQSKGLAPISSLGRFVDKLIQTFEDCRGGLSDETIAQGEKAVEAFFLDLYEKEEGRLDETIRDQPLLEAPARARLRAEVDGRIRKVIIPAYVRIALKFTPRERNDFFLTPDRMHALERVGLGLAGIVLGALAIAAPFIPIWEKWWVGLFMLAGLAFPELRKLFALRRYENELNGLVGRADRDFARIDVAYLTSGEGLEEELSAETAPHARPTPQTEKN